MDLQTPIAKANKSYALYESRLEKLDISTIEDLLYHIPFRYEDYSTISPISKLQEGEVVTVQGKVTTIKNIYTKSYKKIQKATIDDDTGTLEVMWFNQPFLTKSIHSGDTISLSGRIERDKTTLKLVSPEYEILHANAMPLHTGRLVPIYPETKGVSSKWLRRQIYKIFFDQKHNLLEHLPSSIIDKLGFVNLSDAIEQIHFPKNRELAAKAKERLSFDELFLLQLSALMRKNVWRTKLTGHAFAIEPHQVLIQTFWKNLPFQLTSAQQRAVKEILNDLSNDKPMNRLLEGDVGSGKTIVAAIAMYLAFLNGYQSVLMAPTEILAQQHYQTIKTFLEPLGVTVGLATGSKKIGIKNKELRTKVKTHNSEFIIHNSNINPDILVGTHAVLSKNIQFEKLGLVIIDEQQRFGVEQRSIIRDKGTSPHVLTMTATPIPRTVALTLYGDLDLSLLDEMPKARKQIKTWLAPATKRNNGYEWIEKQIKETDSQVFIICPFIEESENMQTVKAASKEYERLQKDVFPNLKLGLLHGKLKAKEKEQVLQDFRDKKFDILIATPVVEVGIDIPNATIIVIEAAERFGLSQLHQLRGRVGRGEKQSYCLLFTESANEQTIMKLKSLEKIHVGAELAELDLKLRGAGDLYGTMQHGVRKLKVASFYDFDLIQKARKEASAVFPELHKYPLLEEKLKQITTSQISPD